MKAKVKIQVKHVQLLLKHHVHRALQTTPKKHIQKKNVYGLGMHQIYEWVIIFIPTIRYKNDQKSHKSLPYDWVKHILFEIK